MDGKGGDEDAPGTLLFGFPLALRNEAFDRVFEFRMIVRNAIFVADQNPGRPIGAARNRRQATSRILHFDGPLSGHVVQAEVEFVVGQLLFHGFRVVLVPVPVLFCLFVFGILSFQASEEGVIVAVVNADRGEGDRPGSVGFQRTGNRLGIRRGRVIQHVDQLALFDGGDHHGASLGVRADVLPRRAAAALRLSEDDDVVAVAGTQAEIQDAERSGIRRNSQQVSFFSGHSNGGDASNDRMRLQPLDQLERRPGDAVDFQQSAGFGHQQLLLSAASASAAASVAGKIANQRLQNGAARFQTHVQQLHGNGIHRNSRQLAVAVAVAIAALIFRLFLFRHSSVYY
mmetsp:Transcript_60989/g.92190  ORF Transcript_60989/g.92190 Transcript_60989/m.92190 type:complete len:343 (-) Transcript_60989:28-1056(-)